MRLTEERPAGERPRRGALAASIAVLGVLLFTWPFVRAPPLGIGAAYAHLLGAWAVTISGLALLARALGRDGRERGRRGGGDARA
jgi:hypothetical protein